MNTDVGKSGWEAEGRGFRQSVAFHEFLTGLYRDRRAGVTVADLYPRIVEWFARQDPAAD